MRSRRSPTARRVVGVVLAAPPEAVVLRPAGVVALDRLARPVVEHVFELAVHRSPALDAAQARSGLHGDRGDAAVLSQGVVVTGEERVEAERDEPDQRDAAEPGHGAQEVEVRGREAGAGRGIAAGLDRVVQRPVDLPARLPEVQLVPGHLADGHGRGALLDLGDRQRRRT